jgi:hypothetical protein
MFSKWFASSYHLIRAVIFNIFNELTKKIIAADNKSFCGCKYKIFFIVFIQYFDFIFIYFLDGKFNES